MKKIITTIFIVVVLAGGFFLFAPERFKSFSEDLQIKMIAFEKRGSTFVESIQNKDVLVVFLGDEGSRSPGRLLAVEDIIDETNKARITAGLSPLRTDQLLARSAQLKTEDMISLQYFEHESPTGVAVSDLGKKVGYDYIIMGENLALGDFRNAKDLVNAWMESPGHRANILNEMYQDIGIYAVKGTYEGQEVWFAVQHFGAQRSACPSIDSALKKEIDQMNRELDTQQVEIEALKKTLESQSAEDNDYDDKVNLFNAMVTAYNKALEISKSKIFEYNRQVGRFNTCLLQYQQ